jgi:putative ABC transport system substrate-binding protein
MITRRFIFICLLTTICVPTRLLAAQPKINIPRIGYLARGSGQGRDDLAFFRGLRELGYIEGQNITIERRAAAGKEERLPELAAELARLKVDVIVALHPRAAHAAQSATKTVSIVMRSSGDPVAEGLVASLAHPGGNVTGVTSISSELYGKRLELLKEVVPKATRIAVLRKSGRDRRQVDDLQAAGRLMGIQLVPLDVEDSNDFERAFRTGHDKGVQALLTLRNPLIVGEKKQIADLTIKNKLPAIYDEREFVDVGGLMSYGTDLGDVYRRAATYVDKILKGRNPTDLPVEQPMKFEFFVNLKAAKQIDLTFPPNVLVRADRVIR